MRNLRRTESIRGEEGVVLRRYLTIGSTLRRNPRLGHSFGLAAFGVALALRFALHG